MYQAPHRPSLLHRPVRGEAKANVENLDAEYQKEQQRIAARAERLASTEDRMASGRERAGRRAACSLGCTYVQYLGAY